MRPVLTRSLLALGGTSFLAPSLAVSLRSGPQSTSPLVFFGRPQHPSTLPSTEVPFPGGEEAVRVALRTCDALLRTWILRTEQGGAPVLFDFDDDAIKQWVDCYGGIDTYMTPLPLFPGNWNDPHLFLQEFAKAADAQLSGVDLQNSQYEVGKTVTEFVDPAFQTSINHTHKGFMRSKLLRQLIYNSRNVFSFFSYHEWVRKLDGVLRSTVEYALNGPAAEVDQGDADVVVSVNPAPGPLRDAEEAPRLLIPLPSKGEASGGRATTCVDGDEEWVNLLCKSNVWVFVHAYRALHDISRLAGGPQESQLAKFVRENVKFWIDTSIDASPLEKSDAVLMLTDVSYRGSEVVVNSLELLKKFSAQNKLYIAAPAVLPMAIDYVTNALVEGFGRAYDDGQEESTSSMEWDWSDDKVLTEVEMAAVLAEKQSAAVDVQEEAIVSKKWFAHLFVGHRGEVAVAKKHNYDRTEVDGRKASEKPLFEEDNVCIEGISGPTQKKKNVPLIPEFKVPNSTSLGAACIIFLKKVLLRREGAAERRSPYATDRRTQYASVERQRPAEAPVKAVGGTTQPTSIAPLATTRGIKRTLDEEDDLLADSPLEGGLLVDEEDRGEIEEAKGETRRARRGRDEEDDAAGLGEEKDEGGADEGGAPAVEEGAGAPDGEDLESKAEAPPDEHTSILLRRPRRLRVHPARVLVS